MSAYSTLNITRSRAIQIVLSKVLGGISDEELEQMMDEILESRLYTCNIVPDHYEDNDDEELKDRLNLA